MKTTLASVLLLAALPVLAEPESRPAEASVPALVDAYLEHTFAHYPSRATAAGRHDFDHQLEDLSAERRAAWVAFNRETATSLGRLLAGDLEDDDRLDAELVRRQAESEVFVHEVLRRPERDPLYWTGILANANVFLLVRDDLPEAERRASAAARAALLPRLAAQARETLQAASPEDVVPDFARAAARQVRGLARFYAEGFVHPEASKSLGELASFLDDLAGRATASPRLGEHWAPLFRLVTGVDEPVEDVLADAEAALVAKRRETADYGRGVWAEVFPGTDPPSDDVALTRALFDRVAQDHAQGTESFVRQYRRLVDEAIAFVRERDVMTLPEELTVVTDRSPSFFIGQAVGGVYPAGPYAPEAPTLLFLPTPPDDATAEQKAAFFRDFNDHFNLMITPHEVIPGHTLQEKLAARHPRKVRALFGDGVYVEGWGTFCERLMLDLGWGGPLDRLAHLKKQLENIARTIVDVRVHTRGMTEEEVLRFVKEEALQDEQFAANMWRRAITSSPQLTTYYLGYRQIWGLYEDVRKARGEGFVLRDFMDGMMAMGPVPVEHYRRRLLGAGH